MASRLQTVLGAGWIVMAAGLASAAPPAPAPAPQAERDDSSVARGKAYTHLMRALLAVRRGEVGTASDEIERAAELQPDSADLFVEGARMLGWAGRRAQSERLARRALDIEPNHHEALSFLADMLVRRIGSDDDKARDEALQLLERLSATDAEMDPETLMMLAQLRHRSGNTQGAIQAAQRLVDERPGDAVAARTLAQLLLRDGREEDALAVMLRYLAQHPFDEDILGFADQMARSLEAWPLVVEILGKHAPYRADLIGIQRLYGNALSNVGRMDEAVATWERAVTGEYPDPMLQLELARAYRRQGRLADAVALLDQLRDLHPDDPFFALSLADALERQRDLDGARGAYTDALDLLRDSEDEEGAALRNDVRRRIAALHMEADELERARRMLEELEGPRDRRSLELAARRAILADDWSAVREAIRGLKSLDERGLAAMLEGEVALHERRFEKAAGRFAEAVELLGPYSRRGIAESYREANQAERGEALLREWVSQEPTQADALYFLGAYLYELDRFDEAETELRKAIQVEPAHAPALNFLGYGLAERKAHLDEALTMIQSALEDDPWNGAYLDSLGWVYYQRGEYEQARQPLERAAREIPKDPTILEHLGDLYLRLGERSLALAAWDRALEAGPEDPAGLRLKIERERASDEATRALSRDDSSKLAVPR